MPQPSVFVNVWPPTRPRPTSTGHVERAPAVSMTVLAPAAPRGSGFLVVVAVAAVIAVVRGLLYAERLEHPLESELELIAGSPFRVVRARRLVRFAVALDVCLLQIAQLHGLGKLRLERDDLLGERSVLGTGVVERDPHHFALLAARRTHDARSDNDPVIARKPSVITSSKIGQPI